MILPETGKPKLTADQFLAMQRTRSETKANMIARAVPAFTALDAFNNTLARTGFGTDNLLEATWYPLTRLSWNYILLQSLYRSNWLVRKMIDAIAEDMLKNWIDFTTELPPQKTKKIDRAVQKTATQEKLLYALKWARLFGGAGAVMIVKGTGKLDTPLNFEDVPLDSYRGLIVLDRWSGITPSAVVCTDLDRPHDYGLPETYRITTERAGAFEVHASRVLRFTGRTLPQWEFQAEQRWGISEIEVTYDELKKRDNTSFNIATLMFRANIIELKQKGLASMISGLSASTQAQQQFYASLSAQVRLMSNQGMMVTDPEGGLSSHQYAFGGIADVYHLFMRDWCAACEIPYSRMFGHEGGLGQNGDADEHTYYDMLGQKQKREVDPQLQKLIPVIAMSTWGTVPDDLEWKWNACRTLSDEQRIELGSKTTTAIVEAYNSGLLWERTAKEELKEQSDVTGMFTNITKEEIEAAQEENAGGEFGLELPGEGGDLEGSKSLKDLPTAAQKGNKLPKTNKREEAA